MLHITPRTNQTSPGLSLRMLPRNLWCSVFLALGLSFVAPLCVPEAFPAAFCQSTVSTISTVSQKQDLSKLSGHWVLEMETAGEALLPVSLRIDAAEDGVLHAVILNGSEELDVEAQFAADSMLLKFPHYDSRIQLTGDAQSMRGTWTKVRGTDKIASLACVAKKIPEPKPASSGETNLAPFLGRFRVTFADSAEPAIGIFRRAEPDSNQIEGTFLTTTGDYRFLAGQVEKGWMTLSCFDGGHAFLFRAQLQTKNKVPQLSGAFYSGNWYEVDWTASKDADIQLPDGFAQSLLREDFADRSLLDLNDPSFSFPDLEGNVKQLNSPEFFDRVTLIEIFGSWCPNCHDEAQLLKELRSKYGPQGLSVLGLAFELTGDLERDTRQVQKYVERYEVDYPILIAGTSNKQIASEQLPLLDQIRSYPTTLFVDRAGKIRSVYTGFSGPATGAAHEKLKARFETLIEQLLNE